MSAGSMLPSPALPLPPRTIPAAILLMTPTTTLVPTGRLPPTESLPRANMAATTSGPTTAQPAERLAAPAIRVDRVSHSYGSRRALIELTLEIGRGELFAVL